MSFKKRFTDGCLTFDPNHEEHLRELQQELHRAHTITPGLMADVIARACPRLQSQHRTAKARIIRLVESGAFADAMTHPARKTEGRRKTDHGHIVRM
jgi:hypothetical protein